MKSEKHQRRALESAGWIEERAGNGFWLAPAGTAPGTHWSTERAFEYLTRGNALRDLAALGWNVPPEFIGAIDNVSFSDHVLHPDKAPVFIRLAKALKMENLPTLAVYEKLAAERGIAKPRLRYLHGDVVTTSSEYDLARQAAAAHPAERVAMCTRCDSFEPESHFAGCASFTTLPARGKRLSTTRETHTQRAEREFKQRTQGPKKWIEGLRRPDNVANLFL